MIRLACCGLLLGYLPGALAFRLPIAQRIRRAHLAAEERAFWHVVLSVAWSLSIVLALAAVRAYSFERLLFVNGGLCVVFLVAARAGLRYRGEAARAGWTVVVPVVLLALGAWRFFPSSEYVIGGRDPGAYINEGIQIAQRGALAINDAVMAAVPGDARPLFFPDNPDPNYESNRFMGFYAMRVAQGEVMGQFPHLYPASIAIGYGLHGLSGARMAVGVWAMLGVVAVYFAGARWLGKPAAFVAAALLSLHVLQVWFARYPNSEAAMQALLFAALLAFARAHQDEDAFFAPIAGVLAGLIIFLRLDGLIVVAALAGTAALTWAVDRRRPRVGFVLTLIATSALGLMYLMGPMRAYFGTPINFLSGFSTARLALPIVAGLAALLGLVLMRRLRFVRTAIPIALIVLVLAASVYAFFFRHADPAVKLTDFDALAFRTFTDFYLFPSVLLVALAGFAVVARRDFWRDPAFFVVLTGFSLLFFYKFRVVPEHFWMARRFLPVFLPGALLLAAAAAFGVPRVRSAEEGHPRRRLGLWRWMQLVVAGVFLIWIGRQYVAAAEPVTHHVEYAGVIPYLETVAARIGDRDLLLLESRDAATDLHVFALPLAYIYARNVLVLATIQPDKRQLEAFLTDALQRYDRVLFLGGGGTNLLSRRIVATPLADGRVHFPEYAHTPWNVYPSGTRRKDFDYSLYQLAIGQQPTGGFVLDVGDRDDLNVLRFHAKEQSDGRSVRWTSNQSFIAIPGLTGTEREVLLTIHDGGRPPQAPRPTVELFLDDVRIGAFAVSAGFTTYRVALPPDLVAAAAAREEPARLRLLLSSTWNPRALLGTSDDRDLGVMVDRVEVH
jgi:4-amino-4-deoxy-L-arabinose transferase-like glycosyltransferase